MENTSHSMLTTRCITSITDFNALEIAWINCVKRLPQATVFQTFAWHKSWIRHFVDAEQLYILTIYDNETLCAIAPLMIKPENKWGFRRRLLVFIGENSSDYLDFMIDPDIREQALTCIMARIFADKHHWDDLRWRDMQSHSPNLSSLQLYLKKQGGNTQVHTLYDAPSRCLGDVEADAQCLRKRSLKRHSNYFKKNGGLRIVHLNDAAAIQPHLETFFSQHRDRWAQTPSPSLFNNQRQQAFYKTLCQQLCAQNHVLFTILFFNDAPIAFHFGFTYNDRLIWYKPSYDSKLAKHSPGQMLIKSLLEHAIENNYQELDFTIGPESFKYRFANTIRKNVELTHRYPCILNHLLALKRTVRQWIGRLQSLRTPDPSEVQT